MLKKKMSGLDNISGVSKEGRRVYTVRNDKFKGDIKQLFRSKGLKIVDVINIGYNTKYITKRIESQALFMYILAIMSVLFLLFGIYSLIKL